MTHFLTRLLVLGAALTVLALPAGAQAGPPLDRLLAAHEPVAVFDPADPFRPSPVESFVDDSRLERLVSGTWIVADPDPDSSTLPGPGTGIWRLNQSPCSPTMPLGGLGCYADAARTSWAPRTVYGRALALPGAIVLQYWLFYYDNTYSYFYPPADVIWQAHEGDWEVVTVVLDADGEPREVGYSQHCLGERRSWARTERRGSHPVVYVGAGSHANYFTPGVHPFDPRCVPPQAAALLLANGLPLPSDYAFGVAGVRGVTGFPSSDLEVLDDEPWLGFPGFWGELQYFRSPFTGVVPFGTAPVGPAYHALWVDPLGTLATWTAS